MFFVRTASERDLEKVRAVMLETFNATYAGLYDALTVQKLIEAGLSPAALKARVQKKGGEFLVADDGKQLGGMGFAVMSDTMTKTAILHQLYVKPDLQRQGIGRDIFAELETCFPDAEIMRLEVEPDNAQAIAFFSGVGFVEVDRTATSSGISGMPVVIMEKPLRG